MEQLVSLVIQYKYLVLLPLAAVQGPIFSLAVGFLVFLGYLKFFLSLIVLVLGDAIMDTVYYYIGRFGDKTKILQRFGPRWNLLPKHFNMVERLWLEHGRKTVFLSKLSWGLSGPFLISAGFVKMPFLKFIKYAVPVACLEYIILLTLGYYLGNSYLAAESYIKFGGLAVAVLLIVFVLLFFYFSRFARKQISKLEEEENKKNEISSGNSR